MCGWTAGGRGRRVHACMIAAMLSVATSMVTTDVVLAQTAPSPAGTLRSFSVPAGPLAPALVNFGRQADVQISYVPSIATGLRTQGVSGSLSTDAALIQLLAGTGLVFQPTGSNTVVIARPGEGNATGATIPGAIALDTIDVSGAGGDGTAKDIPYQTPGSSSYISQEDIARTRGTTVGDTFKGIPGVLTSDDNNGPKFDVSIRGLGIDRVPVRVDGAIAAVTEYRGYSGAGTSNYIDPDLIGGITIKKGPDAGPEGAGAVGGLVSMRTLNADDILKPGQTFGGRIKSGVSDNATPRPPFGTEPEAATGNPKDLWDFSNWTGSLAVASSQEKFDLVAAYVHRESGNYFAGKHGPETITLPQRLDRNRPGDPFLRPPQTIELSPRFKPGDQVLNTSLDTHSWLLKGVFKFDADQVLELAHMGYRAEFGQSMPSTTQITIPGYMRQLDEAETRQDNFTARYRFNPKDNDLLDLKINAAHVRLDNQTMMSRWSNAEIALGIEPYMSSFVKTWTSDISNTSRFHTMWGNIAWTYGASYSHEDLTPPDEREVFLNSNGTREMGSLFTSAEWSPTRWLTLNAGLRYDTFRTKDRSDPADLASPGNGGLRPELAGVVLEGDGLSPSASVTVKPWEGVELYALYAEGFRAPNIWEASNNVVAVNPNLKPERAQNWEAGINLSKNDLIRDGDRARLRLSYFDNTIHDIIVRDYYFRTPSLLSFYYRRYNYDKAQFKGIEIMGEYDMGRVFAGFSATYYTDVKFCRDRYPVVPGEYYYPNSGYGCQDNTFANDYSTNQVPPEWSASVLLGMRLFDDKLTVSGRVTHMGERAGSYLDNVLPSQLWRAYTVVDVFASYKVTEDVSLDFSVENLTDRYYFKPLSQASLPAPGRTIRTGFTARF